MIRIYKKNKRGFLSPQYLKFTEFQCKCDSALCNYIYVHPELVTRFERLRAEFGFAVLVTSGHRCQAHNEKVGGKPNSLHTLGMAIDLVPYTFTGEFRQDLFDKLRLAATKSFDKVKVYDNFIHCQLVFEESPY